jgi:hypothetical protein
MNAISSILARIRTLLTPSLFRHQGGGVVVLAPNAWFASMLAGPAIVAKVLSERGHSVDVISCAAERQTCTIMDGMAPLEERPTRRFCEQCVDRSRDYLARYGLNQHWDIDFLDESSREQLEYGKGTIGDDPVSFTWDGVQIGMLAAGNLSAILKREVFTNISEENRGRLRLMVEDGLRWYFIAKQIYARMRPRHLVYYAEYYPEVIVGMVMSRLGVHVAPVMHSSINGNDFRKLVIVDHFPQVLEMTRRIHHWPAWQSLHLAASQVEEVCDDVVTKLLGYSPISFSPALNQGNELKDILIALRQDCQTIVAFTSSDDELNNTKMQRGMFGLPLDTSGEIFADQSTWLKELAEFVAGSENHQMIVRLHPRLGSNKRSTAVAEYREQVEAVTGVGCPRIHVVLPESTCSSYDLAQQADIVVTSWSSMGLECVRMGLPAIMAFRGTGVYPTDGFLNFHTERKLYFDQLRRGIAVALEDVLQAFRFTYMYLSATSVDLSDLSTSFDDPTLPPYKTPRCADEIEDCIIGGDTIQNRRLSERKAAQGVSAAREELDAFARSIRRIIHVLAFGEDGTPIALEFASAFASSERIAKSDVLVLTMNDDMIGIEYGDKSATRRSKAICSLAKIHEQIVLNDSIAMSAAYH